MALNYFVVPPHAQPPQLQLLDKYQPLLLVFKRAEPVDVAAVEMNVKHQIFP